MNKFLHEISLDHHFDLAVESLDTWKTHNKLRYLSSIGELDEPLNQVADTMNSLYAYVLIEVRYRGLHDLPNLFEVGPEFHGYGNRELPKCVYGSSLLI